jgi:choline dehydrogenase-like flavoprotein
MAQPTYDVCVVGSGPGGGIAAYALTKAGLQVALVEGGRRLRAGIDYGKYDASLAQIGKRMDAHLSGPLPALSRDYSETNHFVPVGDRPRHGQLRALGGRSLCWAGHSLRFGPLDFKQWPISYDEMAPYYSRAELLMGVYGDKDGLSNMPDGEFQKGVAMRCPEKMLKLGVDRLRAKGREMAFVAQRKAMPTEKAAPGRAVCHYCGHCMDGCEVESKYTSANTPIPLAMRTGNLTLLTESTMTRILMRKGEPRVEGIEYSDAKGATNKLLCRALVMSCSTVETARHLLFNGIGNSSGQIGRNLTSHFGLTVVGLFPQVRGRDTAHDDGTDYYHSLLTGMYWEKPSKDFEGTYQVQCGAGFHRTKPAIRFAPGFGTAMKRELEDLNTIHAGMNMQGSLYVSPKKFVDLDPEKKDRFGIPLPRIHLHYEGNDVKMAQDMVNTCEEIIRTAGGTVYQTPGRVDTEKLVIDSNHWVGTMRMGTDRRTSVVNTANQSHDVKNLFIGDSSVYPANPEKNPTLTNIALTWRMSDRLVETFRRREI